MYPDPALMTGGFLGDFVKGRLEDRFPTRIAQGIQTHRSIDAFSDPHPLFKASTDRLRVSLGRYAPIAVDVIYDHCLARQWDALFDISLGQFCDETYRAWDNYRGIMPESARAMASVMQKHRSFERYHETSFIDRTLRSVSQRASKQNPLARAMPAIEPHLPALESDFLAFHPQLVSHTHERLNALNLDRTSQDI